jgi:uncharacterized protein (TIGR02118 family)
MYQVTVFHPSPIADPSFIERYLGEHAEILSRLPGLRHATINLPDPPADGPAPGYQLVTVLYWDDRESALASLAGPVGREAAAHADRPGWPQSLTVHAEGEALVPFSLSRSEAEICGVLGLYVHPSDEEAFRTHYEQTHSVLAARMPYQAAFTVNWTTPGPDGATPPFFLIGNQEWRDRDDFERCLASPEAEAAIADLVNFEPGAMTMLTCRAVVIA